MLRIFADDKQHALALDNLAFRAALSNGGTNFHDNFLLAFSFSQIDYYTVCFLFRLVHNVRPDKSGDSQEQRISFGDGHGMLEMSRQ